MTLPCMPLTQVLKVTVFTGYARETQRKFVFILIPFCAAELIVGVYKKVDISLA